MQPQSSAVSAADELKCYFDRGTYSHAAAIAGLVLERLPSGELAWLRPSTDRAEDDDALYVPTQAGRDLVARMRADEALFGRPWPTVLEASS